jgi:hypothetical protein
MFICILVVYLYGNAAKLQAIAALRTLIGRWTARWRPLRGAPSPPPDGRERKGKSGLNVSSAAARDPPARGR